MLPKSQICIVNRYLPFVVFGLLVAGESGHAQTTCPEETLWEPYSEVCAPVRDVQGDFLPQPQKLTAVHSDAPVPAGGMAAGIAYTPEQLVARDSGRLHTRMFVYPDGLERDAALPFWLYATATSRIDDGLELLAMYSEDQAAGYLGLYAWTCLPDFPCPNGDTARDWQWSRAMPELSCNITHVVDQGGHAQKQLYYANHSDRLDNASPPLWKSAVYLWNYCDSAWDLAWEHLYRQDKDDCSVPGATCAWWGPSIEIFGEVMYPQVGELGYEESLLYHDGTWSLLAPPETQFRDPTNPSWGALTPWQVFHLEPNRSYGVGNWVNENDAPVIEGQEPLVTLAGEPITIHTDALTITDADVDPAYHVAYELSVYGGSNYTASGAEVTPDIDFTGTLRVPVSVNDGAAESTTFELIIEVVPDDGVPVITAQAPLSTPEETALSITLDHFTVVDSNSTFPDDFTLSVKAGANYTRAGNTITPATDFNGDLTVPVTVSDGTAESPVFNASVSVTAVNDRPEITGQKTIVTPKDTPREILLSDLTVNDPDNLYPDDFTLSVREGANYSVMGNIVTPALDFTGSLTVPVAVNDGSIDSAVFNLKVTVGVAPVNEPPSITGQQLIETLERTPVEITVADLSITDPDNDISELSIRVLDGSGYQRAGNTITPEPGIIGTLVVYVVASDGSLDSDVFSLEVQVLADTVPPEITLIGSAAVTVQQGNVYTDPGATATDNVDGDISDRIIVDNPVDTGTVGTYTISFSVADQAGNSVVATRTVTVQAEPTPPPPPASSGGGGSASLLLLALLAAVAFRRADVRRVVGPPGNRTPNLRIYRRAHYINDQLVAQHPSRGLLGKYESI
jgi:hypothetical protein